MFPMHSSDDRELDDIQSRLFKLLPKQPQDVAATAIFLVLMPVGFLLHIFWVLPVWYPAFGEAWVIRVLSMLVLAANVYLNWYKMIHIGPSGRTVLPNVVKPGFRYCHSCHTNAPPRAYHCPVCDVCVFRRDHHCSFGAVCIGHFNQRYFVAAVMNLVVLMAILTNYTWDFIWTRMDGSFSVGRLWQMMLPHLALIARYITFYQFVCLVFLACTFTVFIFSIYLLAAQLFCLWHGQTRIEYLLDVHAYQLTFLENMKHSLGSRWYLIALSPFIPSPLASDGTSFVTREITNHHHSAKDM